MVVETVSKTGKDSTTTKKSSSGGLSFWHFVVGITLANTLYIVYYSITLTLKAGDPLIFIIPNFLLWTPFRDLTYQWWEKVLKYDTTKEIPLIPIPEIKAEEYSYDKVKELSEGFRYPIVVRGLFKNTTAVKKWHTRDYVASHIGDYDVTFLQSGAAVGLEDDRKANYIPFRDAWSEILDNKYSKKYLFFPERSRLKKGNETTLHSMTGLKKNLDKMMAEDLDFDRLFPGFAGPNHKEYIGTQFIAGWGNNDPSKTTGSNWHCAPGNNWFIQVHGHKRWLFVDPVYSAWMHPQRDGIHTMATSSDKMIEMEKYIPVKWVDMEAGDVIYNPAWEWHAIRNLDGLSIGCPIRELYRPNNWRNNFAYTGIIGINHVFSQLGITYGLQPHLNK